MTNNTSKVPISLSRATRHAPSRCQFASTHATARLRAFCATDALCVARNASAATKFAAAHRLQRTVVSRRVFLALYSNTSRSFIAFATLAAATPQSSLAPHCCSRASPLARFLVSPSAAVTRAPFARLGTQLSRPARRRRLGAAVRADACATARQRANGASGRWDADEHVHCVQRRASVLVRLWQLGFATS